MEVLNPLKPRCCKKHNTPLICKRVYWPGDRSHTGHPEPAELMVHLELPHYLPQMYTEAPDEYRTEAVEVLFCETCQSEYPEKLALARKHLAEREAELEKEVTGYFQLSALTEFTYLKEIVPDLRDQPSVAILQRLRADGLRWYAGIIKRWRAEGYQREATKYGLRFIID